MRRCHHASATDVEQIVHKAKKTFESGIWSRANRNFRADVLERAAQLLAGRLDELILLEVQQTGRAIREMKAQVPSLVKWFRYFASLIRTEERAVLPTTGQLHNWIDRQPLGVVVQITPFNHPLLIAVKKLAPALAAGNSVIIKPSELTPLTTLLLGRILHEAGLPEGVLSVVPGYGDKTGKFLVSHPGVKKVDVTGGTPAGRAIGAIVGGNLASYTAELGGKAPVIVTEHANIDVAVNGVAFGAFMASGQTCIAATRVIVHTDMLPEFLDKIKAKAESIERRMGSPLNEQSMMGPLISAKQLARVSELVDDAVQTGLTVVTGGKRMSGPSPLDGFDLDKGYFYAPTIIADPPFTKLLNSRIWREEAFGPVIVVAAYHTETEALQLANDSEFGLGAAVWTRDLSQAYRLSDAIESGIVWSTFGIRIGNVAGH
jgi:acyl-CoA reductase-like NAD-dependent aldehyde dehydrogenase